MMTNQSIVNVVQADIDGKDIERSYAGGKWHNKSEEWDFRTYDYRVKLNPLELWVNVYGSGTEYCYYSESEALRNAGADAKTIKFREVQS